MQPPLVEAFDLDATERQGYAKRSSWRSGVADALTSLVTAARSRAAVSVPFRNEGELDCKAIRAKPRIATGSARTL
jgi:hypothetical protein